MAPRERAWGLRRLVVEPYLYPVSRTSLWVKFSMWFCGREGQNIEGTPCFWLPKNDPTGENRQEELNQTKRVGIFFLFVPCFYIQLPLKE